MMPFRGFLIGSDTIATWQRKFSITGLCPGSFESMKALLGVIFGGGFYTWELYSNSFGILMGLV